MAIAVESVRNVCHTIDSSRSTHFAVHWKLERRCECPTRGQITGTKKKVREEVEISTYAAEPVARVSFEPPPMNGEPEKAGF